MATNQTQAVTIFATSVLRAQSVVLTDDQCSALVIKADRFRAITGETGPTGINVPVVHPGSGELLGCLTYQL